jgi:hypothetical protein
MQREQGGLHDVPVAVAAVAVVGIAMPTTFGPNPVKSRMHRCDSSIAPPL